MAEWFGISQEKQDTFALASQQECCLGCNIKRAGEQGCKVKLVGLQRSSPEDMAALRVLQGSWLQLEVGRGPTIVVGCSSDLLFT